MDLNNIKLNSWQLAELFEDVLIETTPPTEPVPELKTLGKNARNIVLLVHNEEVPFLTDTELHFLTSILSACKLSLADVAIVNTSRLKERAVDAIEPLSPQKVILLGLDPLEIGLPINFPHFQLQVFNKKTYLSSPSLAQLQQEKYLKMNLWNCLKTLFQL
jgi:hypothetical protein